MDLSIIIPAWNESQKIGADVRAATDFLKGQALQGEVIVVDDGSTDGTAAMANGVDLGKAIPPRVIRLREHRGKGWALSVGAAASAGQLVLIVDSGGCIPFSMAKRGIDMIRSGLCHVAIGSRRHPGSTIIKDQSLLRRMESKLFMGLIHRIVGLSGQFTDTQCGFKLFRGEVARELFGISRVDGYLFDLDILLLAQRKGYGVKEFPLEWRCDRDSRIRFFPTLWKSLAEAFRLRRLERS